MKFEFRMALRETRPALKKFIFMITAVSLGVAALTGIKGFSHALAGGMLKSARDLLAADMSVRMSKAPEGEELEVLEAPLKRGALMTRVTETLSMASPQGGGPALLVTVKAVDPRSYPFYGTVELDPPALLRDLLEADSAVVSREFLVRSGTSAGDWIQIGSGRFRIASILVSEPDRLASGFDLAPRVIISREGLERSGLIQFGSRAWETFLYRLPARGLDLETARGMIRSGLKRSARILDYRNPNPSLSRGLERMGRFLSLVGLLAMLLAGVAVATTIHTYLQQKLDGIAIMKSLGGRSGQIVRVYLLQGLVMGALGGLIGVGLGYGVQLLFPPLLRGIIDLPTELDPAPAAALQGFSIGIATTLLFLLPPLLAVRKVRPARVFLREMPETRHSTIARLRHDALPLASAVLLLVGVGALAGWLARSWLGGLIFIGGLAAAVLILAVAARILLFGLKKVPRPESLALRHGLRNLRRPGSHVTAVLIALGIGVGFVLTIYLIQTSLLRQLEQSAPADFPNLFLLGVTDRDKEPIWKFLGSDPEVLDAGKPIPAIPAHVVRVDGKTADELDLDSHDRRFFDIEYTVSWSEEAPPGTTIVEGSWWKPPFEEPMISVGRNAARWLKISVGGTVEFRLGGRVVRARVVNIRDIDFLQPGGGNQFIFSPGALDGVPASYFGGLRVRPREAARIQGELFSRFPNITSINVGEVLTRVQYLLDRIGGVIRFIAGFSILCGVVILASSVAATRYQRIREAVLLKALGASRSQVARIQATEFAIVGLASGLIGGLLGALAADLLLSRLLDAPFEFHWLPILAGMACTAVLAVVTGWAASRGVLNHRPLEILREN